MANNFNNDDNGGFLKTAAGLAPLGAGVGYATREMLKDTRINVGKSTLEEMARKATNISQSVTSPARMNSYLDRVLRPGLDDRVANIAIQQAIGGLDPVTQRRLNINATDFQGLTGPSLHSAIRNKLAVGTMDANILASRFRQNMDALLSQGPLASHIYQPVGGTAITPRFKALPDHLRKAVSGLSQELGQYNISFVSTPQFEKQGLGIFKFQFLDAPGGTLSFDVPLSNKGIMVEGQTMQTRKVAPSFAVLKSNRLHEMTREEFFFHEMQQSILPDIRSGRLASRKDIHGAVGELRRSVFNELETIPNVPSRYMTEAQRIRETIRGQQIDLIMPTDRITEGKMGYVPSYRRVTGEEMGTAIKQFGLYGGTSPSAAAKGRVSKVNVAKLGLAHEAADFGRSPEKGLREYQLTRRGKERLSALQGTRGALYQSLESEEYRNMLKQLGADKLNPSLRTVYVDPDKHGRLMRDLALAEGHVGMSRNVASALEFETTKQMHLKEMRGDLLEDLRSGKAITVAPGEMLGWNESNRPVLASNQMSILSLQEQASTSKGKYATLNYRDIHSVPHGAKFFEDVKATALIQEEQRMSGSIGKFTKNRQFLNNVELVSSMDELKKNRAKFRRQMLTSLADTGILSKESFQAKVPTWGQTSGLDDLAFTRKVMDYAIKSGATASQFGAAFGTVPYVLGDEGIALAKTVGASAQALASMQEGLSTGVARLTFDSPATMKGAGAQGSVEPRMFNLLRDPHWGSTGAAIASEFEERLMRANPEKYQIHKELGKTLQSITGDINAARLGKAFSAENYTYESFQRFIQEGGGHLNIGKGQRSIYIPGADVLTKMRPYITAGGEETIGDLANIYHGIAGSASGLHSNIKMSTVDEYQELLSRNAGELMRHWAPGGKGMGGYLRGQIQGSQYLRAMAMSETGQRIDDLGSVGVTRAAFDDLVGQMEATYGRDVADDLRRRAARGESIHGVQMRHPLIGQFSVQPTNIQILPGHEKQIILPERNIDIEMASGARKNITLGPAVGMAADYDADIISLSLLSPDTEKMVRKNLMQSNAEFTQRYTEHQVRYQLLKAGRAQGAAGALSITEKMAADVRKLGVTQQYVPKLSVEMSKAREALTRFGKGRSAADASMLLEWLEQTPISAKHLSAERVAAGGIEDLMNSLEYGLRHKDAGTLRGVVQEIVGSNEVAAGILNQDIQLSQASAKEISRITGANISQNIRGANINAGIDTLVESLTAAEGTGRTHEILSGRAKRISMHDISTGIRAASNISGKFSGVSSAMTATTNALGQVGRGILKHHKAIGFGFAGSLALSTALSEPPETVGSMSNARPIKPMMNAGKAASRMSQETMLPPQQNLGNPTAPNILAGRQARVEPPRQKINISARMNSTQSMADLAGRLGSSGINHNISVNLRDNRQSLDYNVLANKLL